MFLYFFSLFLIVASNIIYHISQKSTPADINPMVSLLVTYLTAAIFCILLMPFYPNKYGIVESFKKLNLSSICLGFAVVGLELGFLLAYKAGWKISTAQFSATILVTVLLIPVGIVLFKEKVSPINILGMIVCLGGFFLLTYKK